MAMKCPSCGGSLFFNIENNNLECEYCKSTVQVEDYKEKNAAIKQSGAANEMEMSTYTCRNCGAHLSCPSEQIVAYCIYCKGEATLLQKAEKMECPETIIPFRVSKPNVKKLYEEQLASQPFVPKEFKKADFIEGFRGIYLPYWRTKADLQEKTEKLEAEKRFTKGGYDYLQKFRFDAHIHGTVDSGTYDASSSFDDTIAADIAPYSEAEVKPFNEGYLAGFYADMATSPLSSFNDPICETTYSNIKKELKTATGDLDVKDDDVKKLVEIPVANAKTELHPVWFLTWRNKERVAYSVMNGETGKLHMDVPVDLKKFFLASAVLTLIFFGLLSVLPMFILPINLCVYASYLVYLSSRVLGKEIKNIQIKENHVFDFGKTDVDEKVLKQRKADSCLSSFFEIAFIIYFAFILMFSSYSSYPEDVKLTLQLMLVLQVFSLLKGITQIRLIKNKMGLIPLITSILIEIAGIIIADESRQADGWYYAIAIALIAGIILNCLFSILYINYLTTRPVPNFYTREGADNGIK